MYDILNKREEMGDGNLDFKRENKQFTGNGKAEHTTGEFLLGNSGTMRYRR